MKNGNTIIAFLIIVSGTFFLSDANVFQKFMPRSSCMFHNEKLIDLHLVSDVVIFASYVVIGYMLVTLYKRLKTKIPYSDYFWKFGGFIFFCGLTHLVGVVNLYITFYWIDGIVKLITCWFSLLVCIALARDFSKLKSIKSPEQWNDISRKMSEVLTILKKNI